MKKLIIPALFLLLSFSVTAQSMYDNTSVTKIEIYFSTTNWDQLLDNYYAAGLDERLLADSVVINGNMKDSVGVKYKGNSTYSANNAKNPINIALDYVQDNQDYQGFRTIKLSNGQNDPSFVREVLSFEIARKYMKVPQSNYAEVHINGAYHGLYVNTESINSDFQNDYLYADTDNTRFKCNPESVFSGNGSSLAYLGTDSASYEDYYELKSDFAWQDLIDLTYTINSNPTDLESILDVDRALWMLAFNNVLVNLDSYTGPFRQNYYLIKDDNNRMNTITWDLNESLGGFEMINNGGGPGSANLQDLIQLDPILRLGESNWPLIDVLLSDDTYRRMYIAHMRTILEENFGNGLYETRANDLQSIASNLVQTWRAISQLARIEEVVVPITIDTTLSTYQEILEMGMGHAGDNLPKSQALKDATMAHFILKNSRNGHLLVHFNGAFHSKQYEGIYWYLRQANKQLKILTISVVEQDDINALSEGQIGQADFIIATPTNMTKTH